MKAIDILMHEHLIIERMLNVLSDFALKIEQNKRVKPDQLRTCIDFIKTFADACHHQKEEGILFTEMEANGIPVNGGPIGVMLAEHVMGRNYTKEMAKAVDDYEKGLHGADKRFVENARGYINLLSQHIAKENNILYPMAEHILSGMDDRIVNKFEDIEKALGKGVHEKYESIIRQLEKESAY